MYKKYDSIVTRLQRYAKNRMSYPYIGPIKGLFVGDRWVRDDINGKLLIDNSFLGIIPESIASTYINNSGSPYTKSKIIQRDVKEIEIEIIDILTIFFGCKKGDLKGYITSGATEASLSCLWWLREGLIKNSEERVYLISSDQAHYSIKKIANILGLSSFFIKTNLDGSICIATLKEQILKILSSSTNNKIIFSFNVGTTTLGGIDDIPSIYSMIKKLQSKHHFNFRIHTDAAILGLTIPILKTFGTNSIFNYTDTFIFSGHKMLGTTMISGIALAKVSIWENAFLRHSTSVKYIPGIEDVTVSGSRSGYLILEFHNALVSLNINSDANKFIKLITTYKENCNFLVKKLKNILPESEIIYNQKQFNIVFKSPIINNRTLKFFKKYSLMQIEKDKLGICVLAHVDKNLIKRFIKDYKIALCLN